MNFNTEKVFVSWLHNFEDPNNTRDKVVRAIEYGFLRALNLAKLFEGELTRDEYLDFGSYLEELAISYGVLKDDISDSDVADFYKDRY